MQLTMSIDGICNGGGHIHITVTKNGTQSKEFTFHKDDLFFTPDDYETVLVTLIRGLIAREGFTENTPLSQVKTAIEAEVFKL